MKTMTIIQACFQKAKAFFGAICLLTLCLFGQPSPVFSASFTQGNLVVSRAATNTVAAVSVFLDEYSPAGAFVQTVALPTTTSGSNRPFVISGRQNMEGELNLSTDKRYLLMGGYKTGIGNVTAASGNTRIVATVDYTASVNTSTEVTTDMDSWFRTVASTNGTDLWLSSNGGIYYTTLGATTSTKVSTANAMPYYMGIFDNKLYFCGEQAMNRFGYQSNGLPTTANQPYTVLGSAFAPTAIASLQAPYGMIMFDMDATIPGVDVVYMAEGALYGTANTSRGLVKYCVNSSGVWVKSGAIITVPAPLPATDGLKQVTGSYNAATGVVTLYAVTQPAVTANATSSILSITDNTGYNGALAGSFTSLVTSGANTSFRGIALAPQAAAVATVPDASVNVVATPGNTQASVAFSTPNNTGGATITGYTVTPYIAGVAQTPVTGTGSPILVTGLSNGTAYTFTVKATNSVGAGTESAASSAISPLSVPDAPTIGAATVTPNSTTVSVAFTAPASDGGSAITSYTVTSNPRGGVGTLTQAGSGTITVTGLISGNAYTFTVKATSATGSSISSAVSNSVTPCLLPGTGTPTATAGAGQASVAFSNALRGNDQAITSYTVTPYIGTTAQTTVTGTVSPIVVTGLAGGTAYTFKVYATNSTGNGTASAASTEVTPTSAVPGSPTSIVATAGNAQASVAFVAPSANGSAITGYTVTPYIGTTAQTSLIATGTGSPIVVTGLTNGTAYTFTVKATNGVGNSAASTASAAVTPSVNTAVNEVYGKAALSVSAYNGKIKFTAVQGEKLEVYTALGQKLLSKVTVDGVNEITLASKGVMIVKVGNRIAKVTL